MAFAGYKEILKKFGQKYNTPQQELTVQAPSKREADTILQSLPTYVRSSVQTVEVRGNDVVVKFLPGKDSDQAFNTIMSVVKNLQNSNKLVGKNYRVVTE
jgi:hypothetical protein